MEALNELEPLTIPFFTTPLGHTIFLDLYLPTVSSSLVSTEKLELPIVLYFHGGNLLFGSRSHVPKEFRDEILSTNWAFISSSHRFLFPSTAHDILTDLHALFKFLSSPGPTGINAHLPPNTPYTLSPTIIFISGYSAGAYPARLACLHCTPRPKAFFSLAGSGGEFLMPFYVLTKAMGPRLKLERYRKWLYLDPTLHPTPTNRETAKSRIPDESEGGDSRVSLATVLHQTGQRMDYLTGEFGLSEQLRQKHFTPITDISVDSLPSFQDTMPTEHHVLFPELLLADPHSSYARNHPPAILIHGTGDKSVLARSSETTARQLREAGVEVELILVKNWGHGYTERIWERWGRERVVGLFKRAMGEVEVGEASRLG